VGRQARGTLVSVSALPPFGRKDAKEIFFIQESNRAQLIELARLADQGHLRPQVGAVYRLAQAAEAYGAKAVGGIPAESSSSPDRQGGIRARALGVRDGLRPRAHQSPLTSKQKVFDLVWNSSFDSVRYRRADQLICTYENE
jgi:Zinc-binding dehydrogenase